MLLLKHAYSHQKLTFTARYNRRVKYTSTCIHKDSWTPSVWMTILDLSLGPHVNSKKTDCAEDIGPKMSVTLHSFSTSIVSATLAIVCRRRFKFSELWASGYYPRAMHLKSVNNKTMVIYWKRLFQLVQKHWKKRFYPAKEVTFSKA